MEALDTPPPAAPPDPSGTASGAPADGAQPDLLGVAEQVAARHVPTTLPPGYDPATGKRPRGRPRKDGRPAGSVVEPPPAPPLAGVETPPDVPDGYAVDPNFLEDLVIASLKGIEAEEKSRLYAKKLALLNDAKAAREIADRVGPPPGGYAALGKSFVELSRKYNWLSKMTPEAAILGILAAWIGKDVMLFADSKQPAAPQAPAPSAN